MAERVAQQVGQYDHNGLADYVRGIGERLVGHLQTTPYEFRFDIRDDRIGVWIDYSRDGNGGLIATLTGQRCPLTNGRILRAALRRPLGSRRVLALIHWQALKLWFKRATYRARPLPPTDEVSR